MKNKEEKKVQPFNSQKQLQNYVYDKFVQHGHKVRYQFKITSL